MTKQELIESIRKLNPTASSEFLEGFSEDDLVDYLRNLQKLLKPRREKQGAVALAG